MSSRSIEPDGLPPTVLASAAKSTDALEMEFDEEVVQIGASLGRYQVAEKIAHGGMGVICRAVDVALDRDVAIKVLRGCHRDSHRLKQRFIDEARVTGGLQHPGIVPIYEVGETPDGNVFFAMKLVEGETLAELLAETSGHQSDRSRQLQVFQKVCQTVAYAHSRGVIHLDLKPANIMVGEFGEVHVMDWGLCRNLREPSGHDESPTRQPWQRYAHGESIRDPIPPETDECSSPRRHPTGDEVLGTPAYMAPEQARAESVGPLADVFGLGAILCEILTGRPPFCGSTLRETYLNSSRGDLDSAVIALNQSAREEPLVQLAKHCLQIKPASRPKDAGAVAAEIGRFLESMMQRAEHDLARFFEISMDMFCIASLDGYFKRVNANFSRVLGYSDAELVSRPFLDFVHPDDVESTVRVMKKLSEGSPVVQFQNRYRDNGGQYHWMEWTAKSIPKENIVFAVARDVTRRARRESGET